MVTVEIIFKSSCWGALYFTLRIFAEIFCLKHRVLLIAFGIGLLELCKQTAHIDSLCFISSRGICFVGFFLIAKSCWEQFSADQQGGTSTESNTQISSSANSAPFLGRNLE